VSNPIDKTTADKDHALDADRFGVSPQKRPTWAQTEGTPLPLGATWIEEERAFNFAVYAEHAASVTLLLYSADIARAARGSHQMPSFISGLGFTVLAARSLTR